MQNSQENASLPINLSPGIAESKSGEFWTLGDVAVRRIGFGAKRLAGGGGDGAGGADVQDRAIALLRRVVELGVNHVDTAAFYPSRGLAGETRFEPGALPGWADFNSGDIYYGFPNLEGRGFKIAHDAHGPAIDPDRGDRTPSAPALADVRAFMARRFPALSNAPLSEARVCQYENSSNGDLLIDLHPGRPNLLLVGAGSGHGFKHGPAVGRYAADRLLGRLTSIESRFSLASKGTAQARDVH